MPQPLRNQGAVFDPNPIRERPEAAAALANAIAVWNLFEWDLATAYSLAMGFYLPGIKGWEPAHHPAAYDIMDTIAGLGSRLDLLETALEKVAPELATEFQRSLRKTIRGEAGRRAEIAHGRWDINEKYPKDIIRQDNDGGYYRWSVKDFDAYADRFSKLRSDFVKFELKLRDKAKNRSDLVQLPERLQSKLRPRQPKQHGAPRQTGTTQTQR